MKRILFLTIVFHTLYFSLYSKVISSIKSHFDTSIATLYEYGEPIDSCECNFKNLFRNWTPQFITNAQDTELISYKFVETIKDTVRVNYYADLLLNMNVLQSAVRGSNSSESTENGEIHHNERFFEAKSYSQVFADSLLGNNKNKIDNLNKLAFSTLDEDELSYFLMGSSTVCASFEYWQTNIKDWFKLAGIEVQPVSRLKTSGEYNGIKADDITKGMTGADVGGAVAGGIMGAIGGSVVPGAGTASGAALGAVTGGCGASTAKVVENIWNYYFD